MNITDQQIADYSSKYSTKYSINCEYCYNRSITLLDYVSMLSSPLEVYMAQQFVMNTDYKLLLEIGTFTGMMTIGLAEVLPPDSKIITCDLNPKYGAVASDVFQNCGFSEKIEFHLQSAISTIVGLNCKFDFIFIDADKEMYPIYYDHLIPKLKMNGVMILDNMLWGGEVLNPKSRKAIALDQLNEQITLDPRVSNQLLPIGDGWQIVRKIKTNE